MQSLLVQDPGSVRRPILDLHLSGIISTKMRHVIKRYLKRVGFVDVDVVHLLDGGELGVRLVAYGNPPAGADMDIPRKLEVLERELRETLSTKVDGMVPHPSRADPDALRIRLSAVEPSMKRVFCKRA
ncbi:MAG TPA: hypothetical protein VMS77_04910 [Conexivisphaerales archaeon]|nr:hypothetical protein [Conexivisphaerales archaeon]